MQIDYAVPFTTLKGRVIPLDERDEDGALLPFTLGTLCVEVLSMAQDQVSGKEKIRRYEMAKRIMEQESAGQPVEINDADLKLLKKLIGASRYAPLIVGQAFGILGPPEGDEAHAE